MIMVKPELNELIEEGILYIKLLKSLYGLRNSGLNWYNTLINYISTYKLIQSNYDPCLFFNDDQSFIVTIHVDDLLIGYNNLNELERFNLFLINCFKETKVQKGNSINYLGYNISINGNEYILNQIGYIK